MKSKGRSAFTSDPKTIDFFNTCREKVDSITSDQSDRSLAEYLFRIGILYRSGGEKAPDFLIQHKEEVSPELFYNALEASRRHPNAAEKLFKDYKERFGRDDREWKDYCKEAADSRRIVSRGYDHETAKLLCFLGVDAKDAFHREISYDPDGPSMVRRIGYTKEIIKLRGEDKSLGDAIKKAPEIEAILKELKKEKITIGNLNKDKKAELFQAIAEDVFGKEKSKTDEAGKGNTAIPNGAVDAWLQGRKEEKSKSLGVRLRKGIASVFSRKSPAAELREPTAPPEETTDKAASTLPTSQGQPASIVHPTTPTAPPSADLAILAAGGTLDDIPTASRFLMQQLPTPSAPPFDKRSDAEATTPELGRVEQNSETRLDFHEIRIDEIPPTPIYNPASARVVMSEAPDHTPTSEDYAATASSFAKLDETTARLRKLAEPRPGTVTQPINSATRVAAGSQSNKRPVGL